LQDDVPILLPGSDLKIINGLSSFRLGLGANLTHIENTLINSMPSLTLLDLSGSSIQHIPTAIAQLSGLRRLVLGLDPGGIPSLQLVEECGQLRILGLAVWN